SVCRNELVEYLAVRLIAAFQAIDNRPPFNCQLAGICLYPVIGSDPAYLHWQHQFNNIIGRPGSVYINVSVLPPSPDFFSIDTYCYWCRLGSIGIKIRSRRSVSGPPGNAEFNAES